MRPLFWKPWSALPLAPECRGAPWRRWRLHPWPRPSGPLAIWSSRGTPPGALRTSARRPLRGRRRLGTGSERVAVLSGTARGRRSRRSGAWRSTTARTRASRLQAGALGRRVERGRAQCAQSLPRARRRWRADFQHLLPLLLPGQRRPLPLRSAVRALPALRQVCKPPPTSATTGRTSLLQRGPLRRLHRLQDHTLGATRRTTRSPGTRGTTARRMTTWRASTTGPTRPWLRGRLCVELPLDAPVKPLGLLPRGRRGCAPVAMGGVPISRKGRCGGCGWQYSNDALLQLEIWHGSGGL